MNDQISSELEMLLLNTMKGMTNEGAQVYSAGKELVIQAFDKVQNEAPKVVEEFCTYRFYDALVSIIPSFILIGIMIAAYRIFRNKCREIPSSSEAHTFRYIYNVAATGGAIALMYLSIIPSVQQMVKITVAPRVYLIEWAFDRIRFGEEKKANQEMIDHLRSQGYRMTR